MGIKIQWLVWILCMLAGISLSGQSEVVEMTSDEESDESVRLLELTADLILPNLKYKESVNSNIVGFSGAFLVRTKSKNYGLAGIEVSYYSMGSLSNTIQTGIDQFTDFTRSNYGSIKFLYRLYAPFYSDRIEPFLEAGLGPHLFYTMTTTTFFDEDNSSNLVVDEAALGLTYGLAVGATIAVKDQFFAIAKIGLKGGTATRFLHLGDQISSEYPIDNFDLSNDPLSIFQVSLGISYSF